MADSVLWGLFLGLGDGVFYGLARETYDTYLDANKLNSLLTEFDIWKMLGLGAVLGLCAPLGYLWAGSSVGGLLDVHIYRCLISAIFAILFSSYQYDDTVNGYRAIGILMSTIGFFFILLSSSY